MTQGILLSSEQLGNEVILKLWSEEHKKLILYNHTFVDYCLETGEDIQRHDILNDEVQTFNKCKPHDSAFEKDVRFKYLYEGNYTMGGWFDVNTFKPTKLPPAELPDITPTKVEPKKFMAQVEEWFSLLNQPVPKIPRLAFDIECKTEEGIFPNPSRADQEITAIGYSTTDGKRTVNIKSKTKVEGATIFNSEKELIENFFEIITEYPIIVTFNGDNFDLPYLYNRARKLGIAYIPLKTMASSVTTAGTIHIDLYPLFKNKSLKVYTFGNKYKTFGLDAISKALLGHGKISGETMTSEDLVKYCINDVDLTLELTTYDDEIVINILIMLARIYKLPIDYISRTSMSIWSNSLLNWKQIQDKTLIPLSNQLLLKTNPIATKALIDTKKYRGAFVKEPKPGIFFDVKVLDFASLYPSIIKNYNLSFETVNCNHKECESNKLSGLPHWACTKNLGLSPLLLGSLMELRVKYFKPKIKTSSPEKSKIYKTISETIKIVLNGSYGVIGFEGFPYYYLPCAESVTGMGRHIIEDTIKTADNFGITTLYGDSVLGDTPIIIKQNNNISCVPIKSLSSGKIREKVNDDIFVYVGKKFSKIKYIYKHKVNKRGFKILTTTSYIECTEDHSLMINGKKTKPQTLSVGDNLTVMKPPITLANCSIDVDVAWLYGFYLAEGTCGSYICKSGHKTNIRIVQKELPLLEKCKKILKNKLGIDSYIKDYRKSSGVYALNINNPTNYIGYFEDILYSGGEKIVPSCVINSYEHVQTAFLLGLLEGDGGTDNKDKAILKIKHEGYKINDFTWKLTQIHKSIQSGVILLLNNLDINYSVSIRRDKPNIINILILKTHIRTPYNKIKKIIPFMINEDVYDIETEDHVFCGGVGNVLLHNTDSCMTHKPTDKQIDDLIKFAGDRYGISLEVDKVFRFMIFSNRKKNYIGVTPDNNIVIAGLTGKKSNNPPAIRDLFNRVCEPLKTVITDVQLDGIKSTIRDEIKTFVENLETLPLEQLGITMMLSKDIHEYNKIMPAHVKAAKMSGLTKAGSFITFIKSREGSVPIDQAKNIDIKKYKEMIETTVEPLINALGMDFDECTGVGKKTTLDFW